MKTHQVVSNAKSFGNAVETEFTIKSNPKAFAILSANLYTDKESAVIRELSTNAYDAHVEVGCADRPFDVHLPNRMEPWFSVRDYGPGLSETDANTIYNTYFESTKTHSDDYVGCLGLGSKSPLSIAEQFTVESYQNGICRSYIVKWNEKRVPVLVNGGSMPTNEPNGLKVLVQVSRHNFYDWENKSQHVYKRFKTLPNVTGVKNFEVPKVTYTLSGNGWGLRQGNDYAGAFAVMGNIGYRLNVNTSDGMFNKHMRCVLESEIDIQFPIGELEIAASREGLHIDDRTKVNIAKRLQVVCDELNKSVEKEFDGCDTLYSAKCLARELFDYGGSLYKLQHIVNMKNVTINGVAIEDSLLNLKPLEKHGIEVRRFMSSNSRYNYRTQQSVRTVAQSKSLNFQCNKVQTLVFDDMSIGAFSRCQWNVREKYHNDIILIQAADKTAKDELKKFCGIDCDTIIQASALPAKPKAQQTKGAKQNRTVCKFVGDQWTYKVSGHWEPTTVDFANESGIYVQMHRYKVKINDKLEHPENVLCTLQHIKTITGKEPVVYGVKKSQLKNVKDNTNWQLLTDYGKAVAKAKANDKNLAEQLGKANAYHNWDNNNQITIFKQKFTTSNLFSDFVKTVCEYHDVAKKLSNSGELINALNFFNEKAHTKTFAPLNDTWQAILVRYPMLNVFRDTRFGKLTDRVYIEPMQADYVVDYVNFVEKSLTHGKTVV